MGHEKGKSEGGSGGRRGHSMMDHGSPTAEIKDGARIARRNDDARAAVEGLAGTRQSTSMPQPTIEHDKDDDMWTATWAKPGGGGVIAEGKTREQALERFRSAWGLWRREAPRDG